MFWWYAAGGNKGKRLEERKRKFFRVLVFVWPFGSLAAWLWLRSLEWLLPLNQRGCPGNRVVVARHRELVYHPESSAVR